MLRSQQRSKNSQVQGQGLRAASEIITTFSVNLSPVKDNAVRVYGDCRKQLFAGGNKNKEEKKNRCTRISTSYCYNIPARACAVSTH